MRSIIHIFADLDHYEKVNGKVSDIIRYVVSLNLSTGVTDMDRYNAIHKSIEAHMKNKPFGQVVQFDASINMRDTASGKTSHFTVCYYAVNKQCTEKAEAYNIERQSMNSIKQLLKPCIKNTASNVSMTDALKMLGFDEEDRGQYLNEDGEYKRQDLVSRWGHLFQGGTK